MLTAGLESSHGTITSVGLSLEVCVSPKKASIIIIIIMNADQGSLSFQLLVLMEDCMTLVLHCACSPL